MARVVDVQGNFKVLETKRGVVVINEFGSYCNHAHFENLKAAKNCIILINKKLRPHSQYIEKAIIRLIGLELFESFTDKPVKPKYRNRR